MKTFSSAVCNSLNNYSSFKQMHNENSVLLLVADPGFRESWQIILNPPKRL